jgi:adenylate cyclase
MLDAPEPENPPNTAIMFTALAGSGSRSLQDESLEHALIEEHGRLVRELLPRHGGREVKKVEEGFLLEFDGGLAAVRFGLALQEALAARNQGLPPEQQLMLRIGVHVGPVVHQDGDVFGEGVNLAARLEALAQPGTLYVTESVAREVRGQPLPPTMRLGRAELKRIRLPVGVFRIEPRNHSPRPALFARVRSLMTHLRPGG